MDGPQEAGTYNWLYLLFWIEEKMGFYAQILKTSSYLHSLKHEIHGLQVRY